MKSLSLFQKKAFMWFIIIDILLLPNFKFLVMPISMPIIIIWFFLNFNDIKKDFSFRIFIILTIFMIISTLVSALSINNNDIIINNFKRNFQIILSFFYFFYFSSYIYKINIKKILLIFIGIVDLIFLIYILNQDFYFSIKNFLGIRDLFISMFLEGSNGSFFRYSFLWIDPNNCAYIVSAIIFYLLENEKLNYIEKSYLLSSYLCILIGCMSNGAFISAAICIFLIIIIRITEKKIKIRKVFKIKKFILSFFSYCIGIIFIYISINFLLQKGIIETSLNRINNNSSESRLKIYSDIIKEKGIIKYVITGEGYTLIVRNTIRKPHSDHLRIFYGYGSIAYITVIIFLFRIRKGIPIKSQIFMVPAIICFSINTLLDEQKIFIIYLFLLSCSRYRNSKVKLKY